MNSLKGIHMRKHWPAFTAFALLIAAYTVLNFILPTNAETLTRYNLTETSARALRLSIVLPLIIIWTITMYGYVRFKNYALSIENNKDGKALSKIADGFLAVVLWLPLSSLINNGASYLYHKYPQLTEELVIVRNYLAIIAIMLAVYIIWKGSEQLIGTAKLQKSAATVKARLSILIAALGLVFAYLVLFSPAKNIPPSPTTPASFYLPDWLLILTIIVPYVLIWFWGVQAVGNVYMYSQNVKGIIYRGALTYLAKGLAFTVLSLLLIRYLGAMVAWLHTLALKPLLVLLYLLILVIGVGAVLMAIGSRKLKKIEEA